MSEVRIKKYVSRWNNKPMEVEYYLSPYGRPGVDGCLMNVVNTNLPEIYQRACDNDETVWKYEGSYSPQEVAAQLRAMFKRSPKWLPRLYRLPGAPKQEYDWRVLRDVTPKLVEAITDPAQVVL